MGASFHSAPSRATGSEQPTAQEIRAWSVSVPRRAWRYIVIHHSGTSAGSAAQFDAFTDRHDAEPGRTSAQGGMRDLDCAMTVRVGKMTFTDWVALRLRDQFTDTFIFRISASACLPP